MSGYLVMVEYNDIMTTYMVGAERPKDAEDEVNRRTGLKNAHALAPVTQEVLDQHEVRRGNAWVYRSMQISTGEVAFSRLGETAL
ncbi:MAG TPA: hypothetical protein VF574_07880 [Allosphingosinicella sp.]|jgi:hypothetical protein